MLTHQFELSEKTYNELPTLKDKLLADILAYSAEEEFYSKISHIVCDRNRGKEWNKNDESLMEDYNKNLEIAITTKHALLKVYKSIYGKLKSETEKAIEESVAQLVDHALEAYGWVEPKKETETPIVKENYVVEKIGEYNGYKYAVCLMSLGHRCGYVAIPKGHRYYGTEYDFLDIDCHGGLTYSDSGYPLDDGNWYIGFDTAHLGDGKDIKALMKYYPNRKDVKAIVDLEMNMFGVDRHIWSIDDIEAECRHIIRQLTDDGDEDEDDDYCWDCGNGMMKWEGYYVSTPEDV